MLIQPVYSDSLPENLRRRKFQGAESYFSRNFQSCFHYTLNGIFVPQKQNKLILPLLGESEVAFSQRKL